MHASCNILNRYFFVRFSVCWLFLYIRARIMWAEEKINSGLESICERFKHYTSLKIAIDCNDMNSILILPRDMFLVCIFVCSKTKYSLLACRNFNLSYTHREREMRTASGSILHGHRKTIWAKYYMWNENNQNTEESTAYTGNAKRIRKFISKWNETNAKR